MTLRAYFIRGGWRKKSAKDHALLRCDGDIIIRYRGVFDDREWNIFEENWILRNNCVNRIFYVDILQKIIMKIDEQLENDHSQIRDFQKIMNTNFMSFLVR